jgi:hypothetical protein
MPDKVETVECVAKDRVEVSIKTDDPAGQLHVIWVIFTGTR